MERVTGRQLAKIVRSKDVWSNSCIFLLFLFIVRAIQPLHVKRTKAAYKNLATKS
jgi:hypothetical protein